MDCAFKDGLMSKTLSCQTATSLVQETTNSLDFMFAGFDFVENIAHECGASCWQTLT